MQKELFRDAGLIGGLTTVLFLTGSVLLHVFTLLTILISVIAGLFVGYLRYRPLNQHKDNRSEPPIILSVGEKMGCASLVMLQALLSWTLFSHQADIGISSPWQILPSYIFPMFGLSLFLLFLIADTLPAWLRRLLWAWQFFLAFSVSAIVYRLGFGFDPFIHQAAARYLVAHGDIQLPSILYIGQYALEAGIARLTPISIAGIDRWLIPFFGVWLGAILLPRALRTWNIEGRITSAWPLLLLPFLPFTFTVPYHIAYVCFLLIICLLPYLQTRQGLLLAVCLTSFTAFVHPLLAIPAIALILSIWIGKRWPSLLGVSAFFLTSIGLVSSFLFYAYTLGGTITSPAILSLQNAFLVIFGFPYEGFRWPWYAWAFYGFMHLWPLCFSIIGWIGYGYLSSSHRSLRSPLLGVAIGMIASGIFLAATTTLTNIISAEQHEFALRLRYAAPLLFLPGVVFFFHSWKQRLDETPRLIAYALLAAFATSIWYTSYPQANTFVQTASPGVSRADIDTVNAIEQLAQGTSYAALTPQMTSAAALKSIGFERELSRDSRQRYPYAIPTGGEFYELYLRLWEEPDAAQIIRGAQSMTHETQIFIAIPKEWDPNRSIYDRLAPFADAHEIVDSVVDLYQYKK